MREWENADIKFDVFLNSSEDSNLFLRKFYEELSKYGKIGWNLLSYRTDKVIYIGNTNFGEMWLEYKERGKISKIYFKTSSEEIQKQVKAALKCAKQNHNIMKHYTIEVVFDTDDIMFCDMGRNGIQINSTEMEGRKFTRVIFSACAFGEYDIEYVKMQKVNYLKHLLCAYTNIIFSCVKITCNEGIYDTYDNKWQEPNQDWIEVEDEFVNIENKTMSLRPEFFVLFRKTIDIFEYNREIRLLLNASQEIFCSKKMINTVLQSGDDWNMPGYTDLINTLIISVLEPLSNIYGTGSERCNECGNLKYSIRKKIRDLCNTYLPKYLAEEIYDKGYGERSAFLHEGYPITNEFYCGHCVPLINPVDGRSVLFPVAQLNLNLFDYVTYIFRKIASDILNENIL